MQKSRSQKALLIIGIFLLGACMRSPFTALPTVITEIAHSFHVEVTNLGILTTIPLLCFGILSPFVAIISRHLGNESVVLIALIVLICGSLTRTINYHALIIGTLLVGISITFINVLLPAIITDRLPKQIGLMTSLYGVALDMFSAIFAYIIAPLSSLSNWQSAVIILTFLPIITLLIWIPSVKTRHVYHEKIVKVNKSTIWKNPRAWLLLLYMSGSSMAFYITVTWLPTIARNAGMSHNNASIIAGFLQLFSMPAAFIIPLWASKLSNCKPLVWGSSLATIIGFLGLIVPTHNFAYYTILTILLGLGTAASYSLIMTLFGLKTTNPSETRDLSGMVQSVGYIIAATGPVLTGWLKSLTGSWTASLIFSAAVTIVCTIFGLLTENHRYVTK